MYRITRTDAQRLRREIERRGLPQTEAARRLGIDHSTLYRYLAGKLPVPVSVLAAATGRCVLDSAPEPNDE